MNEEIEFIENRAMIPIPENAVEIEICAKVYHDGEIIKAYKTLSFSEVQTAVRKAAEGYIDEDDRFFITDKGREYLEQLADDLK